MTNFEKRMEFIKKVDLGIKGQKAENDKSRNKKFLVFASEEFEEPFVKGFDSMLEVENFLSKKSYEIWELSKESLKTCGHFLPCDVHSFEEAKERTNNFYTVKITK